jgi:hypothetical protein
MCTIQRADGFYTGMEKMGDASGNTGFSNAVRELHAENDGVTATGTATGAAPGAAASLASTTRAKRSSGTILTGKSSLPAPIAAPSETATSVLIGGAGKTLLGN